MLSKMVGKRSRDSSATLCLSQGTWEPQSWTKILFFRETTSLAEAMFSTSAVGNTDQ